MKKTEKKIACIEGSITELFGEVSKRIEEFSFYPFPEGIPANALNASGSDCPLYMWIDGTSLFYYTDAPRIIICAHDMFAGCKKVKWIDTSRLDPVCLESFDDMFFECESLEALSLPLFERCVPKSAARMFSGCRRLKSIFGLEWLDTSECENLDEMFKGCSSLEKIDISMFSLNKLITAEGMFACCRHLKKAELGAFYAPKLKSVARMFDQCWHLEKVENTRFYVPEIEDMSNMFAMCFNLEKAPLFDDRYINLRKTRNMFYTCRSLREFDLYKPACVEDSENMIAGCDLLESEDMIRAWSE